MTIAIGASQETAFSRDRLSGVSRANAIDRWIYVFTAASFIAVVLAGFVPDSFAKVAAIKAGQHLPFPLVLHVHAVLMGSFLLLLLVQTMLVATGRRAGHMQLGIAALGLTPAIVVTGFILVPTVYHAAWNAAQSAPPAARQHFQGALPILDDIFLLQLRGGILFAILMWIALRVRSRDAGLHKRLILLAVTAVLGAAVNRLDWLPTSFPRDTYSLDFFTLLPVAPLFIWDLTRNRSLHRAWLVWAVFYVPVTAAVYMLWDTPFWHATARHIMGV